MRWQRLANQTNKEGKIQQPRKAERPLIKPKNDDLFEALNGVMIEIDYLFKEETDKLNQLHEIMGNYKK